MTIDFVFTEAERARCDEIVQRLEQLQELLAGQTLASPPDPAAWYNYLATMKRIQGNVNNDLSFVACLMAKQYLAQHHGILSFDAAAKAQGAPGLDVDVRTADGRRLIAEIKTTDPFHLKDFGAQQKQRFMEGFAKLRNTPADLKYVFVTERRAYEILIRKYAIQIPGVQIVLLGGCVDASV